MDKNAKSPLQAERSSFIQTSSQDNIWWNNLIFPKVTYGLSSKVKSPSLISSRLGLNG